MFLKMMLVIIVEINIYQWKVRPCSAYIKCNYLPSLKKKKEKKSNYLPTMKAEKKKYIN